jgi:hypothetical protein
MANSDQKRNLATTEKKTNADDSANPVFMEKVRIDPGATALGLVYRGTWTLALLGRLQPRYPRTASTHLLLPITSFDGKQYLAHCGYGHSAGGGENNKK